MPLLQGHGALRATGCVLAPICPFDVVSASIRFKTSDSGLALGAAGALRGLAGRSAGRFSAPLDELADNCSLKWTPKTGQSNKLLLTVQEGGNDVTETEVPYGGV